MTMIAKMGKRGIVKINVVPVTSFWMGHVTSAVRKLFWSGIATFRACPTRNILIVVKECANDFIPNIMDGSLKKKKRTTYTIYIWFQKKKKTNYYFYVQKADGIYVTFMLVAGFLIVCVYIAAIYVAKKKRLQNVKNSQILFSGVAVLDLISDVNIVYKFIYTGIYVYTVYTAYIYMYICPI